MSWECLQNQRPFTFEMKTKHHRIFVQQALPQDANEMLVSQ
jgi:hypothetical protein